MSLDRRHTILDRSHKYLLVKRTNDFAVMTTIKEEAVITVPFYPMGLALDVAEDRARAAFDLCHEMRWR